MLVDAITSRMNRKTALMALEIRSSRFRPLAHDAAGKIRGDRVNVRCK